MKRLAATIVGSSILALRLVGCDANLAKAESIREDEAIDAGSRDQAGSWLFWPTAVRIHPLTRVIKDPPSVDARLEFRDEIGETTKLVGTIVLAIDCDKAEPRELRWKMTIDSLAAQERYYDEVTATYRFELAPSWTKAPPEGTSITLRAFLFGADGTTAVASERLTW